MGQPSGDAAQPSPIVRPSKKQLEPEGGSPRARDVPDAASAKAVRLLWCDTAGIRRCRIVPGRRYAAVQAGSGVCITTACMAMPAYGDSPAAGAGLSCVGETRMLPVEGTRVGLPWAPGHQMALVEFRAPRTEGPWDCCPRRALRNTLKMLEDNFKLTLKVGFEVEFLLLERVPSGPGAEGAGAGAAAGGTSGSGPGLYGTSWRPVDAGLYCQTSAVNKQAAVLDEMVEALAAVGVEVLQWHAESAPGQYEFALRYYDALESCDKLLLAKEAIMGVAQSRGLAVSFLPKPLRTAAGSGCHAHISLWRDGKSHMAQCSGGAASSPAAWISSVAGSGAGASMSMPASGGSGSGKAAKVEGAGEPHGASQLRPTEEMLSFMAGMLSYLEVLLPFTSPCPSSYERLRPGTWAGSYSAWGWNNREAPIRLTAPGPSQLSDMHIEYKPLDGAANPHIALAAVAVAGMLGLSFKLVPPEPCQVPPADLDKDAAARLGVRPLPASLDEALAVLTNSRTGEGFKAAMTEAIGAPLLQAHLAVRLAEAEHARQDLPGELLLRY
ncbi:hypothetical protein HYH03_006596 [Edaphochlamys debaryana]|uniref:GS catalytic domain-containing protein n=1 Tax=Edaphochlamys debaryana TaxID=47281 RepID=A0A836C013_9CHLO|nr:hypothetical protein HYH03_006596 [Edaphochlamys debaryana]|eukprot:KAG2495326.1 hypothetical protein HYH03_006596 [Edaphochlamys debaryana]